MSHDFLSINKRKTGVIAALAQLAARQSHNLKVASSSLAGGITFFDFSSAVRRNLLSDLTYSKISRLDGSFTLRITILLSSIGSYLRTVEIPFFMTVVEAVNSPELASEMLIKL